MIHWYYFLVVALALAVFLLYKEWTRRNRARLAGRLLASVLAVISLLLMAYPYAENNIAAANKLVLLTDGFDKDSVNNFLKNGDRGIPVFSLAQIQKYTASKVELVTDLNKFSSLHATDTMHVFGSGFNGDQLSSLAPHPIVFHAAAVAPSFSNIYWKQDPETGEKLTVQGSYNNSGSQKVKIVLQAFGTDKDSVTIAPHLHKDFELHTIPVHTGNAVFSLMVLAAKDTLQKEPVPVTVKPISALQLLIVSSSPDFDNTYLKNHLSQQGYQVTIATALSSNKTDRQFLNMPAPQTGSRLSAAYLNKFDVLMTDQETLQKISLAELSAIRSAIQEKGMGLIIKMDNQNRQAFYARFFPVKIQKQEKQSFLLLHNSANDSNRYKIKMTEPLSIGYTAGMQIILQDAQSDIYAAAAIYGSGKIVATTLQNTFSMALAGDKQSYQQLWWLLLNKAAKKIYPDETWRTQPFISIANQPVQLQVENSAPVTQKAVAGKTAIYLKQDALLPFAWNGMYWPAEAGWQPLPRIDTASGDWYVYKSGDWQQMINYQQTEATRMYADRYPAISAKEPGTGKSVSGPFKIYLLLIFLASCIFYGWNKNWDEREFIF